MRNRIFKTTVILSCVLAAASASGETVSQKMAKEYAQQFFDVAYGESVAPVKFVYNGKRLTTDRLFTPFYVYNEPRGGYVVISAENKTFPILAYSLKESFDPDRLGEKETAILRNYATDIENIRYDSRIPEEAIHAWGDMEAYIKGLLNAKYESTDPTITMEEATSTLEHLWNTDAGLDSYADLYTPSQWQEMVDNELSTRRSAAIGYIDQKGLHPVVVYGKKGDYYRIETDGRNDGYYRLMASELLGDRQLLSTLNPTYKAEEMEETAPFTFYEEFARSAAREREEAEARRLDPLQGKPMVKNIGGGHFEVILPEEVQLAMLYNINGSHIGRRTYKNTNTAHINIEGEPTGFYFALLIGESGKPYGIKLYR